MKALLCYILIACLFLTGCSATSQDETEIAYSEPIIESTVFEPYQATLKSGHYIVGMDIPAGVYKISVAKGNGNLICSEAGVNEIMGVNDDPMYIEEYNNADLEVGYILSVLDITVRIETDAADMTNVYKRDNPAQNKVILKPGIYVSGQDFDPGAYDVFVREGYGNVVSDNSDRGINAIMGETEDDLCITEFNNLLLDEGTSLEVSGLTILLYPSK